MDVDNNSYTCKVGAIDQNGVLTENHSVGPEGISEVVNGIRGCSMVGVSPDASLEAIGESNGNTMVEPCTQDMDGLTDVHVEINCSPAVENVEIKVSKEPKPQKIQGRGKNEKSSSIKTAVRPLVKKADNAAETKGTSNGTLPANTRPKQPVVKNKSLNESHATNSDLSKGTKPTPASHNARKDKLPKSEMMSSSGNLVQSEGTVEKSTLKPLRKGSAAQADEDTESVESATTAGSKSHKAGKLPTYDFSFKCHERAEKRKEFYTKLEERIHAQEIEKTNQQAKSKECQEAELKMLRKSLNFKAAPMPTFYQEPPPPKVELKKMPTTRARSPKLGRKKDSTVVEGDGDRSRRPGRLSLDEKVLPQRKPGRLPGPIQSKQPQRKSLPRLPSEKTRLSKARLEVPFTTQVKDNMVTETVPIAHIEEDVSAPDIDFVPIARCDDEEVEVS